MIVPTQDILKQNGGSPEEAKILSIWLVADFYEV